MIAAAMRVFDVYNAYMLSVHGVPYPHRRHEQNKSQWPACRDIAILCLENEWPIETYVQETAQLVQRSSAMMHPRALLAGNVINAYDTGRREHTLVHDPHNTWVYHNDDLNARIMQDGQPRDVLLYSPMTAYPAWFRLFAGELTDALYEFYSNEAHHELAFDKPLRSYLRAHCNARFVELEQRWGRFSDGESI